MSDSSDHDEARALAGALANHLEHQRRFRGLRFVPSGRGGMSVSAQDEAPATAAKPLVAPQEPYRASPSKQPQESVSQLQARLRREQMAAWPAARKLEYLQSETVGDCRRCALCQGRTNVVFGVGSAQADLMFIGEGPGAREDERGEPFVGPAGKRLDTWIEGAGLSRERVYIANVVKCRPPQNRDPQPEEVARCSPFLRAQIRIVQPKVLIAVGRVAAQLLLETKRSLRSMRGVVHDYREPKSGVDIPLIVTAHPAYVLRVEGGAGPPNDGNDRKSENELALDDVRKAVSLATGEVAG